MAFLFIQFNYKRRTTGTFRQKAAKQLAAFCIYDFLNSALACKPWFNVLINCSRGVRCLWGSRRAGLNGLYTAFKAFDRAPLCLQAFALAKARITPAEW